MRIIFIHGLGEDESIFKNISPAIGHEQVFLNVWNILGNAKHEGLNVFNFSKKIAGQYSISSNDWVIGHSMGGRIAYYLKHHTGCHIIQIASATNIMDRYITPIRSGKIAYWFTRNGIGFNNFQKWFYVRKYKGMPSQQIFAETFSNLIKGNKECIISQLKLIYEPVPAIDVVPDLRIHALKDALVKPPREPFHEVPGDHFSLITHPEEVIKPILVC
ncbi:MAG: alpha/beta hydrolase [Panacibacter sp.]